MGVISHCGLLCSSPMISNVEHFFMYLLAVCMSSLEKYLVRASDFLTGLFGGFAIMFHEFFILTSYHIYIYIYDLQIFSFIYRVAFSFC